MSQAAARVTKSTHKPVRLGPASLRRLRDKENAVGPRAVAAAPAAAKSVVSLPVKVVAPRKSFRLPTALPRVDARMILDEIDMIRRYYRRSHTFPAAPALYADERVSALHHWSALCTAALTPPCADGFAVSNLTSALANGVVVACIIAYYHPATLPPNTIEWPTKRTAAAAETSDDSSADSNSRWVGAFSFAEIARATESDDTKRARNNFARIRSALNALAIADMNVTPIQQREQDAVAVLTSFANKFIPESHKLHAAKRIQRAYRRYRQRRNDPRQKIVTPAAAITATATATVAVVVAAPMYAARLEGVRQRMAQRQRTHSQYHLASERLVGVVYAHKLRRYFDAFRDAATEDRARRIFHVTRIQSIFRGNIARRRYHNDVYLKLLNARQSEWRRTCDAAATRIQSVWRGYRKRQIVFHLMRMKADAEAEVLRRAQTSSAVSSALRIQRWWRHHRSVAAYGLSVLHWFRYKAAVTNIQRCVRGWRSRRVIDFARSRIAALRIQSVWRAHVVRRCLHRDHRLTMIRLQLRRPHQRTDSIGVRADGAVNALMTAQTMSEVTTACATLEIATRLVRATIQTAVDAGAVPALYAIIRSANRSRAHVHLVTICFRLLLNITATFSGYSAVFSYDGAADALTEQMHVYRDKFEAFVAAAQLLERYKWSAAASVSGKRVESLRQLLTHQLALEHKYAKRFHSFHENGAHAIPNAHAHTIRDSKRIVQLQTALHHCTTILQHMTTTTTR